MTNLLTIIDPFSLILGIFVGFITGTILYSSVSHKNERIGSVTRMIIAIGILSLWGYSMFVDVRNGTSNTQFMLHAIASAVLAYIYPGAGKFILNFVKR